MLLFIALATAAKVEMHVVEHRWCGASSVPLRAERGGTGTMGVKLHPSLSKLLIVPQGMTLCSQSALIWAHRLSIEK